MSKVLKIAATGFAIAGLAVVTGGAALGLGASLGTTILGTGISAGGLLAIGTGLSIGASLLGRGSSAPPPLNDGDRYRLSIDPRTPRKIVVGTVAMDADLRAL